MFGLFKSKKKSPIDAIFDALDPQSVKAMGSAAKVLLGQLMLCRHQPNYVAEMQSKFVHGYLFGFFDAATQRLGLPHKSEEDAMLRIIAGHSILFHDLDIDAIQYVKDSICLQGDSIYKAAHQQGVDDLYQCFENRERPPFGLSKHFIDHR